MTRREEDEERERQGRILRVLHMYYMYTCMFIIAGADLCRLRWYLTRSAVAWVSAEEPERQQ